MICCAAHGQCGSALVYDVDCASLGEKPRGVECSLFACHESSSAAAEVEVFTAHTTVERCRRCFSESASAQTRESPEAA